jgi:hypothetical protein
MKSSRRFNIELKKKSIHSKLLLYRELRQKKLRSVITRVYTYLYPDYSFIQTRIQRNKNKKNVRLVFNLNTEDSSLLESSTVEASTQTNPEASVKALKFEFCNEKGDVLCSQNLEDKIKFIIAFFEYLKIYFKSAEAVSNTAQTERYILLVEKNCAFLSGNPDVFGSCFSKKADFRQRSSICNFFTSIKRFSFNILTIQNVNLVNLPNKAVFKKSELKISKMSGADLNRNQVLPSKIIPLSFHKTAENKNDLLIAELKEALLRRNSKDHSSINLNLNE